MQDINRIERKHYIIGALVISLAFVLQPFSLLFVQVNIAPLLAPSFMAQGGGDGSTEYAGKEISVDDLKVRGNPDASIYLVEYSDYQCPFCSRFHDVPKQVVEASGGKVAWAWKHFPLTQIHPQARPASIAAECVFRLGGTEKFWSYSDALIANQDKLTDQLFKSEASKLGVSASQFNICLNDKSVGTLVDNDATEGTTLGVNGTPSTFVVRNENGKLTILENINGALPKETVDSIIAKYSE